MAATEDALGELHNKVATVLTKALDGKELPEVTDEDGTVIQEAIVMEPSAATITAAIQFLKNNNITCAPSENNALGELKKKMDERQARRANRSLPPGVADLEAARESANFLGNKLTGS